MVAKGTVIRILCCFLASIMTIGILQWTAAGQNKEKNHFLRIFPPHFLISEKSITLDNDEYYISGISQNSIYLGSYIDPSNLFIVSWDLKNPLHHKFNYTNKNSFPVSSLKAGVDSPYIFVNNFTTGSIFRGTISKLGDTLEQMPYFKKYSSAFLPYGQGKFAIRTYDTIKKENVIARISVDSPYYIQFPEILTKQKEGIFSTDGMLRYDATSACFVYAYYYRNQFICIDTNFNILYRGKTLDTNDYAKIQVQEIDNQLTTAIASPNFKINRAFCFNSKWIFINSDLLADNEDKSILKTFTVIDVYSLKDGRYHFSFYLPKAIGKIADLAIRNDTLIAVQGKSLVLYPLNMRQIRNQ